MLSAAGATEEMSSREKGGGQNLDRGAREQEDWPQRKTGTWCELGISCALGVLTKSKTGRWKPKSTGVETNQR
jgi:hypothetical protein